MATFLIKNEKRIVRQQGDDCDVVFTVPDVFPLVNPQVKFWIFNNPNVGAIIKGNADMTISGQQITIPINAADTANKSGTFSWELEVQQGGKKTTIGRGKFEIVKTTIK